MKKEINIDQTMNSGDGAYSYTHNSTLQRNAANAGKDVIKKAVMENVDLEKLLCGSKRLAIADLGCSVGPNTFLAMQAIIKTLASTDLEIQVFFNDQTANDFNALFASLPTQRNYFTAGVPGSFYGRLFPSSSIHIAYSAYAIHWLSKAPEALLVKDSPAWNGGKIHYTGASDAVVKAYADQFESDVEAFLKARGEEIASGGMMVILMPGVPDGMVEHAVGVIFTFLESILTDMVKEGIVEQERVDSFNIPHMYPTVKEMKRMIDKNGSFEIVKMEVMNAMANTAVAGEMVVESAIMHLRAFTEGTIGNHFGDEIVEQLFSRAIQHKLTLTRMFLSSGVQLASQLCAVLKRK